MQITLGGVPNERAIDTNENIARTIAIHAQKIATGSSSVVPRNGKTIGASRKASPGQCIEISLVGSSAGSTPAFGVGSQRPSASLFQRGPYSSNTSYQVTYLPLTVHAV